MSLHCQPIGHIPEETVRVARAAFPKSNLYMKMRDELGTFYEDHDFEDLFPQRGQPAETPWRLALVIIMQFVEGLSDRQAAEAVRARIDWKYTLGLELMDPGFDFSVLCEFRARLVNGRNEERLLSLMLKKFKEQGLLKAHSQQRTDSTHVLASVRKLNRLESVGETLRAALNSLAAVEPEWLCEQVTPEWFDRYSLRIEEYRLPKGKEAREAYAAQIGADGFHLLKAIDAKTVPEIKELPAVKTLRKMWEHQYEQKDGQVRLKPAKELLPSGVRFDSPYDPEAHYGNKRTTTWSGYKVHITETCEDNEVHLITHVETTNAVVPDVEMTETIHKALGEKELLPNEHIVDGGYVDANILVSSPKKHGVEIIGPVRSDGSWQAKAGEGYDISHFIVNWEKKKVVCPEGKVSKKWSLSKDAFGGDIINIQFGRKDCRECLCRAKCTKAKKNPRELTLRLKEQHEALQVARHQQVTEEWKEKYDRRAGIEGTLSQGVRAFELRQSRYIGLAKTHLQNVIIGAGINLVRIVNWLMQKPHAKTRCSRFAALAANS